MHRILILALALTVWHIGFKHEPCIRHFFIRHPCTERTSRYTANYTINCHQHGHTMAIHSHLKEASGAASMQEGGRVNLHGKANGFKQTAQKRWKAKNGTEKSTDDRILMPKPTEGTSHQSRTSRTKSRRPERFKRTETGRFGQILSKLAICGQIWRKKHATL